MASQCNGILHTNFPAYIFLKSDNSPWVHCPIDNKLKSCRQIKYFQGGYNAAENPRNKKPFKPVAEEASTESQTILYMPGDVLSDMKEPG